MRGPGMGPRAQAVRPAAEDPSNYRVALLAWSRRGRPVEEVGMAGREGSARVAGMTAALATVSAGALVVLALLGSARLEAPLVDSAIGVAAPVAPPVILSGPSPAVPSIAHGATHGAVPAQPGAVEGPRASTAAATPDRSSSRPVPPAPVGPDGADKAARRAGTPAQGAPADVSTPTPEPEPTVNVQAEPARTPEASVTPEPARTPEPSVTPEPSAT